MGGSAWRSFRCRVAARRRWAREASWCCPGRISIAGVAFRPSSQPIGPRKAKTPAETGVFFIPAVDFGNRLVEVARHAHSDRPWLGRHRVDLLLSLIHISEPTR